MTCAISRTQVGFFRFRLPSRNQDVREAASSPRANGVAALPRSRTASRTAMDSEPVLTRATAPRRPRRSDRSSSRSGGEKHDHLRDVLRRCRPLQQRAARSSGRLRASGQALVHTVSTNPGATAFTRTAGRARARFRVMLISAACSRRRPCCCRPPPPGHRGGVEPPRPSSGAMRPPAAWAQRNGPAGSSTGSPARTPR